MMWLLVMMQNCQLLSKFKVDVTKYLMKRFSLKCSVRASDEKKKELVAIVCLWFFYLKPCYNWLASTETKDYLSSHNLEQLTRCYMFSVFKTNKGWMRLATGQSHQRCILLHMDERVCSFQCCLTSLRLNLTMQALTSFARFVNSKQFHNTTSVWTNTVLNKNVSTAMLKIWSFIMQYLI